jgi:hypothetical protein
VQTPSEHRPLEWHIGCHLVEREGAGHQWHHPPCVVRSDDADPTEAATPQERDSVDEVMQPSLFLLNRAVPPLVWRLFDCASGELWQAGGGVILQIEPQLVPPLVGFCQCNGDVPSHLTALEMDARAPH